jgi:hypothetical protein
MFGVRSPLLPRGSEAQIMCAQAEQRMFRVQTLLLLRDSEPKHCLPRPSSRCLRFRFRFRTTSEPQISPAQAEQPMLGAQMPFANGGRNPERASLAPGERPMFGGCEFPFARRLGCSDNACSGGAAHVWGSNAISEWWPEPRTCPAQAEQPKFGVRIPLCPEAWRLK